MGVKYLNLTGLRIGYAEYNPQHKRTVLFVHGNSGSSRTWVNQIKDARFSNYRLITIDLPAHGESDPSSDPVNDYSCTGLGRVLATAINSLHQSKPFVVAGISFGTNIIAEMLQYLSGPDGLILISPSAVGKGCELDKVFVSDQPVLFTDEVTRSDVYEFFRKYLSGSEYLDILTEDFLSVKGEFRSSLLKSVLAELYSDEVELLKNYKLPLLIIFGESENIIQKNYLDHILPNLWQSRIHFVEGGGHFIHLENSREVNKLMEKYLDDCFK